MSDVTIRHSSATAGREIKASAHYAYITNGITLDGSKFTVNELVLEGTCLVKDNTSGLYEKYADATGAFPAGKSNPVILDESIKFQATDAGTNPNVTAGQVLVHGAVYNGMLIGVTTAFKTALQGFIRFV
ncbi:MULTISPECIES: hypothetical protein [Pelosinus]|uniref:Uncharacterized protein n=1 Tax=Pelosinus fermentans B4 TaxID=1149862 RepID=I8RMA2_9FIRM|nr:MULTISPECIES: hypothetical protein [Pelosinus]EIW19920.1 hypothetical protein FB4_0171 [Pelosinus fermentans B4]EIW21223.1 hypothetical protein FA11_0950 [Pelosinus fermentans A11]